MFIILLFTMLSAISFAVVTNSATSTISLTAITIPDISVGNIDFGDYVLSDTKPSSETAAITITNGAPNRDIGLSVSNTSITLSDGSSHTIGATLSLSPATQTLDSSGDGTGTLTVSLDAAPTTAGSYTGTGTVVVQYN